MKFIDFTEIEVQAGNGGSGIISFASAKGKPKLGPDGGDGGRGGDVYFIGNPQLNTLSHIRYKRLYCAEDGKRGGSNGCTGKSGNDLTVSVPCGTIVRVKDENVILGEVLDQGQRLLVAEGGRGGLGNIHFVKPSKQAPYQCTKGKAGEHVTLQIELKVLADVGLVGMPNAGKSTLLSKMSNARPKIADYPFTTLTPNLGVVELPPESTDWANSYVVADIPGLIEGASQGKGLGHQFLKHIERTSVLLYVIDSFSYDDNTAQPLQSFEALSREIKNYSKHLGIKKALIALNKVDLIATKEQLDKSIKYFHKLNLETIPISAATGEGINYLKQRLSELVQECH